MTTPSEAPPTPNSEDTTNALQRLVEALARRAARNMFRAALAAQGDAAKEADS